MNGREILKNVLSLVDISKVDLPSYNISVKKYNEIANLYTRVIYLSSILILRANKSETEKDAEQLRAARETVVAIAENPAKYLYENAIATAGIAVESAIDKTFGHYIGKDDPHIRTLRNSTKKSIVVDNMKRMHRTLSFFEKNSDETVIDFCVSEEIFAQQIELYKSVRETRAVTAVCAVADEGQVASPEPTEEEIKPVAKKHSFLAKLFGKS